MTHCFPPLPTSFDSSFPLPFSFNCSGSPSISSPKYLNTKHRTHLPLSCVRENCSQLILQIFSGELINSSLRGVFNYSVKWSVNGQSEIYYIILYVSEPSVYKPTRLSLQWLRSYRITDIWNWIRLISRCLLTDHRPRPNLQDNSSDTVLQGLLICMIQFLQHTSI